MNHVSNHRLSGARPTLTPAQIPAQKTCAENDGARSQAKIVTRAWIVAALFVAILILPPTVAAQPRREARALWAHPPDAGRNLESVRQFVEQCKRANIDTIVMLVKGYTDQWLLPMIEEIATNYAVDSIHHDYVRYPGDTVARFPAARRTCATSFTTTAFIRSALSCARPGTA